MKVICKRTFFKENLNAFPVNGKLYGEKYIAFEKNKTYSYKEPKDYEKSVGVYLIVESELKNICLPIKESEFKKYFLSLEENRNNKINEILNR